MAPLVHAKPATERPEVLAFVESHDHYLLHACGVSLSMQGRVADGQLAQIMKCGSLHTLDISQSSAVTDVAGLRQCASLHTLQLNLSTAVWIRAIRDELRLSRGSCNGLIRI